MTRSVGSETETSLGSSEVIMSYSEVQTKTEDEEEEAGNAVMLVPRYCPAACYKQEIAVPLYITLVLGCVGCLTMLVVFGVGVVQPYQETLRFLPAVCEVVHSNYTGHRELCSCGDGCTSSFPCITNFVRHNVTLPASYSYEHKVSVNKTVTTVLYDSEVELDTPGCTYRPPVCLETNHMNDMEVTDYEFHWGGLGMHFACLQHPTNPEVVIRFRKADRANVAQYLVWPSLLLVALLAILIWTYQRFGCGLCVRTSIAFLTCRPVDTVYWRNGTIALGKL